jgi:hypothetical protein
VFVKALRLGGSSKFGGSWEWKTFIEGDESDGPLVYDPRVGEKVSVSQTTGEDVFGPGVGFGFKMVWLAVRSGDVDAVVGVLSDRVFVVDVVSGVGLLQVSC